MDEDDILRVDAELERTSEVDPAVDVRLHVLPGEFDIGELFAYRR